MAEPVRRWQRYSNEDIELLCEEVKKRTPLSELEKRLHRTAGGIIEKIRSLEKRAGFGISKEDVKRYLQEYYRMNRDYWVNYQKSKLRKIRERQKKYYENNKAKIKEVQARYRETHKDKIKRLMKKYRRRKKLFCIIEGIRDLGYELGKVSLNEEKWEISLEIIEKDVEMEMVVRDIKESIAEALERFGLLKYLPKIKVGGFKEYILISPEKAFETLKNSENFQKSLQNFLEAYYFFLVRQKRL